MHILRKWFMVALACALLWSPTVGLVMANPDQGFRNVQVGDPELQIKVEGEAKIWEATYHYRVVANGAVVKEDFGTASIGAPDWGSFTEDIRIPKNELVGKKQVTLELFEIDAATGNEVNKLSIPLDSIKNPYSNKIFKDVQVEANMIYPISGEASVFEANYHYEASDGHYILDFGFGTASKGGPEWGTFQQEVSVPWHQLPVNGSIVVELFEPNSADEGPERLFSHFVRVDQLPW